MTIGDFTLVNAFMFQLFQPLNFLGFVYREIKASIANIERMFELHDEEPSVKDDGTEALVVSQGEVLFKDISFSYAENRTILNNLNLHLEADKNIEVVRSSSTHKSNLTKFLFQFYYP